MWLVPRLTSVVPFVFVLSLLAVSIVTFEGSERFQDLQPHFEGSNPKEFCAPKGTISDACCDFETVDKVNDLLFPRVQELMKTGFFKYYKLNLYKECPFWNEHGQCMNRACAVETIDESAIPKMWRSNVLGALQTTTGLHFQPFKECEFKDQDFCVVENEADKEGVYVNLLDNPERFTGYAGPSANRIWKSIYEENCFNVAQRMEASRIANPGSSPARKNDLANLLNPSHASSADEEEICFEKRVYYRLISGLHSSISIHLCNEYLNQTTGEWGPNLSCFVERVATHPERLQNLYFNYVVLLRAISKMSGYLQSYTFCTGDAEEDATVKQVVNELVDEAVSCPHAFDEGLMFAAPDARILKEEFKARFRNVSRIMDCVGCDKCRLWGKIQTSGIGTALKVLFSYDDKYFNPRTNPNLLNRMELVALFNTFSRFSESLKAVEKFRKLYEAQTISESEGLAGSNQKAETHHPRLYSDSSQDSSHNNTLWMTMCDHLLYCTQSMLDFVVHQLEQWNIPVPVPLKKLSI